MSARLVLRSACTAALLLPAVIACSCSEESPAPPAAAADTAEAEPAPHPFPGPALANVRRTFHSTEPPLGDYGFEIARIEPVPLAIPRDTHGLAPHPAIDLPGSLGPHRIIQRATTVQEELATCTYVDAVPTAEMPGRLRQVAWGGVEHDDTRLAWCADDGQKLHAGPNLLWEAELLLKGKVVGRNSLGLIIPEGTPTLEAPPLEPADWPAEAEEYVRHIGVVFAAHTAGRRSRPFDGTGSMVAQTLSEPVTQATPLKAILINHGRRPIERIEGALVRKGRPFSGKCPPLKSRRPIPPGGAAEFDVALPAGWQFDLAEMHETLPLKIWKIELGEPTASEAAGSLPPDRRPSP